MISKSDLTTEVKYFGAKVGSYTETNGNAYALIGYVDVKHSRLDENGNLVENLVFHANLTQRTLEEVAGKSAEEIQALAQTEADEILATEQAIKVQDDYITLVNLGLY